MCGFVGGTIAVAISFVVRELLAEFRFVSVFLEGALSSRGVEIVQESVMRGKERRTWTERLWQSFSTVWSVSRRFVLGYI